MATNSKIYMSAWRKAHPAAMKTARQAWAAKNPLATRIGRNLHRLNHNLKKAGLPAISAVDIIAAWVGGTQLCEICGHALELGIGAKPYAAHIDHDHKTGQFRGFLCQRCNQQLGHYEAWPDFHKFASKYLEAQHVD